jgi:hypothetical protein
MNFSAMTVNSSQFLIFMVCCLSASITYNNYRYTDDLSRAEGLLIFRLTSLLHIRQYAPLFLPKVRLMTKIFLMLLSLLLCSALPASAVGKRPAVAWNYYHFDGTAFIAGPSTDGNLTVAVREKMRPAVVTTAMTPAEPEALPDGSGVIAGICYLQSIGGKLGGSHSYAPYARIPLLISSGGKQFVTVQTDDHGYFIAVLPAGIYTVGSGPFTAEITVERGITTLVPLRTGKRMVD